MELTLTGGSTLGDHSRASTPVHSNSNAKVNQDNHSHTHNHTNHNHGHSHNHNTHGGNCCNPRQPRPTPKIDASTLLPSKEVVQRFKTDQKFRLNVLSNVVRGGPYELFTNLVAVLVLDTSDTIVTTDDARDDEEVIKGANPASLAQLLDGFGADGHTLTHWCAKRGADPRFLSFLIERSYVGAQLLLDLHLPSKDSVGMYPLHWAVTEGAIPLVSMLLQHLEDRPSPTQRVSSSSTMSPSSLMQDEDELAESNNTNNPSNVGIDAKDSSGCTPLLIASQYGHPDLAAFLIQRGANPSAVDGSRDTALHWAAYKGSVEVCGMLLHLLGVEGLLDAQDAFGQSPLHLASLRGNADTVRFLMEEAGSLDERSGGLESAVVGRVGSKTNKSNRASFFYPRKLLSMMDKEDKTPRDLAIKKKKLGCELLLQEYEELYVQPKRSFFSRLGRTFKDLCSIRSWKTWMGMGGGDLTIDQSLTFPFYWMTLHILLAGLFYATEFVGIGGRRSAVDNTLLLDKSGLHLFYVVAWIATWWNLYKVYKTNPGVLDARGENKISAAPATCQLICCSSRGGYPKDKVSMEMDSVTKELRRQYDDIIESYSRNFPSEEKRVPLCHTCRIVKPMRSKHCRVARRCVLVFDHHCPFVGTTIGLYNYVYFYLFLLSFCTMACAFITAWVMQLGRSKLFPKAIFLIGGYFAIYLIPVMAMAFYHTTLVLSNSSTNEQMNARKYRYFWDESGRFNNPFNQGKIRNILQRCWPDRSSYELIRPGGSCCGGEIEMTNEEEEREPMLSNIV